MTTNELTLSFGLPGLNQIISAAKSHRMAYATMKKKYTALISGELLANECVPIQPYKAIRVRFLWGEPKQHRRDPDNIMAGQKMFIDSMVQVGIIENDTIDHVSEILHQFTTTPTRCVSVFWKKG